MQDTSMTCYQVCGLKFYKVFKPLKPRYDDGDNMIIFFQRGGQVCTSCMDKLKYLICAGGLLLSLRTYDSVSIMWV
jgi:hypothetical protein